MLVLAALLGAAVSAPAQVVIEARLGRDLRGAVVIGNQRDHRDRDHRDHRDHGRVDRSRDHCEPIRRAPLPRGRWETVEEQYLVPGYWDEQHVPPTYGWIRDHCGHRSPSPPPARPGSLRPPPLGHHRPRWLPPGLGAGSLGDPLPPGVGDLLSVAPEPVGG